MIELIKIPVFFEQEQHKYYNTDTGAELKGITSTLIKRLNPTKYSNVPDSILTKAAERGRLIHEEIELIESLGIEPNTTEAKNYLALRDKEGMKCIACEHTVSDLENYATNIDAIYEVDDTTVDLVDFKTTYKLDKESAAWQLSICAKFLESNNLGRIKVRNLYVIWLRGDIAKLVRVDRISDEDMEALIYADIHDKDYEYSASIPDYISANELKISILSEKIKQMHDELEACKKEVLDKMMENDVKSIDTGTTLFTVVAAQQRISFDAKAFKKEHAKMYDKYTKITETKPTIKITIRDVTD